MIKWCAYCQTYLGEIPPAEEYLFSHGICESCLTAGANEDAKQVAQMKPIARFYEELRDSGFDGNPMTFKEIAQQAALLKIQPTDLCIGILQPILYQIGQRWSEGTLTVAEEHLFTSVTQTTLELLYEHHISEAPGVVAKPSILLLTAEGNYHVLGARMLDFFLKHHGVQSQIIFPGLPATEALRLVKENEPRIVGFSIGNKEQFESILEFQGLVDGAVKSGMRKPIIAVGGFEIRNGWRPSKSSDIVFISDPKEFLRWYQQDIQGPLR